MRQLEVDWLFSSVGKSASKLFPEAWKDFESAVENIGREPAASVDNEAPDARAALKGYHIVFLTQQSDDNTQQLQEAEAKKVEEVTRAWRRWEFLMSMAHKLPSQPSNGLNMSDQSAMMNVLKEWDAAHIDSPVLNARKGYGEGRDESRF